MLVDPRRLGVLLAGRLLGGQADGEESTMCRKYRTCKDIGQGVEVVSVDKLTQYKKKQYKDEEYKGCRKRRMKLRRKRTIRSTNNMSRRMTQFTDNDDNEDDDSAADDEVDDVDNDNSNNNDDDDGDDDTFPLSIIEVQAP